MMKVKSLYASDAAICDNPSFLYGGRKRQREAGQSWYGLHQHQLVAWFQEKKRSGLWTEQLWVCKKVGAHMKQHAGLGTDRWATMFGKNFFTLLL